MGRRKKPQVPAQVKPTNRRAFVAWLTHELNRQHGIVLETPVRYESLRDALMLVGLQPGDR